MNIQSIFSAVTQTSNVEGVRGLIRVIMQAIAQYCSAHVTDSIYENKLLFRYGSCNDLISLKAKYLEQCYDFKENSSHGWGLKQIGTLFCLEKYNQIKPKRILEVGAGYNTFFDEHIAHETEYWMIDDIGFYEKDKFNEALTKRNKTTFIKGLLGSSSNELADNYFDFIFSISVLEHVPFEHLNEVYADMFRILRSGGIIVHSIDSMSLKRIRQDYLKLKEAGFILTPQPDTNQYLIGEITTLFEPVDIVFKYYDGVKENMWKQPKLFRGHTATVLVFARKP